MIRNVQKLGNLCLVMEDNFDTLDLQNTWTRDVNLGGFGYVYLYFHVLFLLYSGVLLPLLALDSSGDPLGPV